MAKDARMLNVSISKSLQVDKLPLAARLLFTWMIPHADDNGRLKGDPKYIKGCIVPLTNWSPKNIRKYLELMKDEGLIYYWEENREWFVEFVKWNLYQHIRADRYKASDLPSFHKNSDNQTSTNHQPDDNPTEPEVNINKINTNKPNPNKFNISESKEPIADKNLSYKEETPEGKDDNPLVGADSKDGYVAFTIWRRMEPKNLKVGGLYNSYAKKIPHNLLFQWASEIEQDNTVSNKGALFNSKAKEYLDKRSGETGSS